MTDILTLAVALAAAGAASGFLAGVFGVGGGAILVPVIDQFLAFLGYNDDVRLHVALGTSLGIIIPTALRSFYAHKARGAVDMNLLKAWLIPIPLGAILATVVAAMISGEALRAIFAVIAFVVALRLLFRLDRVRLGEDVPKGLWTFVGGVIIGLVASLMGVGGGVMSNTFMTLYGRPIHQAVATSAGVGVLIAAPGAIGYALTGLQVPGLPPYSVGYVNLLGVVIMMPLTLLFAPLGVRVAHGASKRKLEVCFGLFLIVIAALFGYEIATD